MSAQSSDDVAIVAFVFIAVGVVIVAGFALAVPVGMFAHMMWTLLAYGWGLV